MNTETEDVGPPPAKGQAVLPNSDSEKALREAIEEIQDLTPIEELIGAVVALSPEKPGRRKLYGQCPWNSAHSRNLIVYPTRQYWRCWPCRREGGIVEFVAFHEKVSKEEALRRLAERVGVKLPPS